MKTKFILALLLGMVVHARAALPVPAFTAYLEPADGGAWIARDSGITGWDDPAQKIRWFGELKNAGDLACTVQLHLPAGQISKLRLTVAGAAHEITATGAATPTTVDFGTFAIAAPGYQSFTLESLNAKGAGAGDVVSLKLDGPAAVDAHFNLKERRNTASVHLAYPTAGITNIDAFYCEVTGVETPLWTYFEACGWHRGYFGMQVNSPTERRIEPVDV